jgi:hypothetical protein
MEDPGGVRREAAQQTRVGGKGMACRGDLAPCLITSTAI